MFSSSISILDSPALLPSRLPLQPLLLYRIIIQLILISNRYERILFRFIYENCKKKMQGIKWKSKRYLGVGVKNSQNQKKKHTNNQPNKSMNGERNVWQKEANEMNRFCCKEEKQIKRTNKRQSCVFVVAWSAATTAKAKPSFEIGIENNIERMISYMADIISDFFCHCCRWFRWSFQHFSRPLPRKQ